MHPRFLMITAICAAASFPSLLLSQEAAPAPSAEAEAADQPKPEIVQVSKNEYRLGDILFNSETREIRIPGTINQRQNIIEYVLVHEQGKTHESLLATPVSPFQLNLVLKLLNYRSGRGAIFDFLYPDESERPPAEPLGSGVNVLVSWEDREPVLVNTLVEDWSQHTALQKQPWTCTGSTVREGQFMAEVEGSIIALYVDEFAMFNLNHIQNANDENWYPLTKEVPPPETPVTIFFRPTDDSPDSPHPAP